ncbi:uncharacterized protein LOC114725909 [Neltuma alba]|uniref:uncharacterized protein LOC114725909 n=1 Tax=Neltuma alba TaxID=207710 RepID=UPI0010A4BDCC|nr:uncharacterized protein LOC114725909 [Prosopis alba]
MWGKAGKVDVVDIDMDYFLVEFQSKEDYELALTGGPWIVMDSYLVVMRWKPAFNPLSEVIDKVAVWVRLPVISIDLYDKKILYAIGSEIGRVIKVDGPTARRKRGRFARVCVEVDLKKPLLPHYAIDGRCYPIEYESMNLLCLACGTYGHVREDCKKEVEQGQEKETSSEVGGDTMMRNGNSVAKESEDNNGGGLWRVVQRNRRGRRPRSMTDTVGAPSRFEILRQNGVEVEQREREMQNVRGGSNTGTGGMEEGRRTEKRTIGKKALKDITSERMVRAEASSYGKSKTEFRKVNKMQDRSEGGDFFAAQRRVGEEMRLQKDCMETDEVVEVHKEWGVEEENAGGQIVLSRGRNGCEGLMNQFDPDGDGEQRRNWRDIVENEMQSVNDMGVRLDGQGGIVGKDLAASY